MTEEKARQLISNSQTLPRNELTREILDAMERVAREVTRRGAPFVGWTDDSLRRFLARPTEFQAGIIEHLRNYAGILEKGPSQCASIADEYEFLESAFQSMKMRPKDPHWKKLLKRGQIIEIYSSDMFQRYRNLEFLRQCSYDMLTVFSYEWFELYERPQAVSEAIFKRAWEVMSTSEVGMPYNIPASLMRERHLDATGVFEVKLDHIIPLFGEDGKPAGLLHGVDSQLAVAPGQAANVEMLGSKKL